LCVASNRISTFLLPIQILKKKERGILNQDKMSFLKKLAKEFEELKTSHEEKKKHEGGGEHQPPPHTDQSYAQHPYDQQQYAPPPQQSSMPPLPPGWTAQFDQSSQRWFYIEVATGRSQWEPPYNPDGQKGFVEHGAPAGYEEHKGEHKEEKEKKEEKEDPKKKPARRPEQTEKEREKGKRKTGKAK